jgi:hypothetical protein
MPVLKPVPARLIAVFPLALLVTDEVEQVVQRQPLQLVRACMAQAGQGFIGGVTPRNRKAW